MTDAFHTIDVKALRERLGWTQDRLAAELGLDRSTISRMESGQPPSGPATILLKKLFQSAASPLDDGGGVSRGDAPQTTGNGS